ncbi:Cytochrome P450 4c3 [Orchesella cincta]|uniref:aromatase n=1 Tax=Orchesella cincta TaxID=48709 RepID=A0A1D2MSU7_ORCCI|nr:Cytochrome P450 4c3 [Orchesella cincta]
MVKCTPKKQNFRSFGTSNLKGWDNLPKVSVLKFIWALRDLRTAMDKVSRFFSNNGKPFIISVLKEQLVILNNPSAGQQLLTSKDLEHGTKSPVFYSTLHDMLGKGVLTSKGEYWQMQRRLLSKGFTYSALKRYTKIYNKCTKRLVTNLGTLFAKTFEYQQINSLIHVCSIQIITETVMGLDTFKDTKEAELIADSFNSLKNIALTRVRLAWLLMWDPIWKLHPLSREHDKNLKDVDAVIKTLIARQREFRDENVEKSRKLDSKQLDDDDLRNEDDIPFDNMLELMYKSGLNETQIMSEVKTLIWAGYETTSAAMHYLLFMLALNKNHQEACRNEIDKIFDEPNVSPNGELTMEGLSEMKHLEHCFLETLRMFPVVVSLTRFLESPLKIDDSLTIPAGVNALLPLGSYHKMPEYFPSPEKFEPDRFLAENSAKRQALTFMPFSAGPRSCIGLKFAIMEAKTVVAHILREFEVHTSDKLEDIAIIPAMVSCPERDYYFYLKRRNYHPENMDDEISIN